MTEGFARAIPRLHRRRHYYFNSYTFSATSLTPPT